MRSRTVLRMAAVLLALSVAPTVLAEEALTAPVTDFVPASEAGIKGEAVVALDDGRKVLRAHGGFSGRIDLKKLGLEPSDYDLIKIQVKGGRGSWLRLSLENYPNPQELSHWYVLDGQRGPFGWRTIWIDLRRPEEIKPPGYKGMANKDPGLRGLQITGHISDTRRRIHTSERAMYLGELRFCKQAVHLDWDQTKAPWTWGDGLPLVFNYPLTVTNRLDRPITAGLSLVPFDVKQAQAKLSEGKVALGPGETKTVHALISLPADVAQTAEPLYCERFEARARAEGIEDSEVTILRSSDPIHLSVTVPIPADNVQVPLLPRPSRLPDYLVDFVEDHARQVAVARKPEDLITQLRERGNIDKTRSFMATLVSAAYVYDFTAEERYFEIARKLLAALPDEWQRRQAQWRKEQVAPISTGILTASTLSLGWRVSGTQRWPYNYGGTGGNDGSGSMGAILYCFEILSPKLDQAFRKRFIHDFLVPAGIQARNHYIGNGNQQCTAMSVSLYAGLVAQNWPLASFAYSAEHGLKDQIKWAFDDDGLCLEGHYQAYTCRPVTWMTEMLYSAGVNCYDERLYTILHSKGAEAIGMSYTDPIVRFADAKRFAPEVKRAGPKTDGYHLSGSTLLQWKGLQVAMNWGTHIMRSSLDRCALSVRAAKDAGKLRRLACGGGSYNHSSFGQSVIVIDESIQHAVPAEVVSYDVTGPVQHVMTRSDEHYPGSVITRTFVLLDRHVLVVDRVVNKNRPRIVDWQLQNAGAKLSVDAEQRKGSWTTKPDDVSRAHRFGGSVKSYRYARTDETFTEGGGRLMILGAPKTEIMTWGGRRTNLIVRRRGVRWTDFVALLSLDKKKIDRVPVKTADGKDAEAVALRVTIGGARPFLVIVNYEPPGTKVTAGSINTAERFATDFKP